ncbi:MAG: tetratricopeptide repeat protein [Candidatus Omnitrophica bacterium]|nr:tetratricopeptide repeat protein [Candidatus Omnitrophota bacterium]
MPRTGSLRSARAGLILILLSAWASGAQAELASSYAAVQQAFLREDFETTAVLAQRFLTQSPAAPETRRVWLWLALSLHRLQRSSDALGELDQLKLRLAKDDGLWWSEVLFWEGEVCRQSFQMVRAARAYRHLLEAYPESTWGPQAEIGLGLVLLHQQDVRGALPHFHRVALREESGAVAVDAKLFEGFCHLRLQDYREAADMLEPLLEQAQGPELIAQTSLYLAEAYGGLKRYDEAAAAYLRVREAAPESSWAGVALFGLGWTRYQQARCEESVPLVTQYLARPAGDHQTEALFAQGSCLLRAGKDTEAMASLRQLMAKDPGHPLALDAGVVIADFHRRWGQLEAAKSVLHTLLRLHLDAASRERLQVPLAAIALDAGNPVQAKTIYELAAASANPAIRQAALNGLGEAQIVMGDLAAARHEFERAAAVAPETPLGAYAAYQLGRIHLQDGAFDDAVTMFERVAAMPQASIADDAKLTLVVAYLNQGDEERAARALEGLRQAPANALLAARAAYYAALLALNREEPAEVLRLCQEAIAGAPRTDEAFEAQLLLIDVQSSEQPGDAMARRLREWYQSGTFSARHRAKLAVRLGDLARQADAHADAISWYDEALRIWPTDRGESMYRIASCYEEGGDLETAMAWYQRIDQPPWRVRGGLALAKLLERQERFDAAEAIYQELAAEPIPEANVVEERLAALRRERRESAQ